MTSEEKLEPDQIAAPTTSLLQQLPKNPAKEHRIQQTNRKRHV